MTMAEIITGLTSHSTPVKILSTPPEQLKQDETSPRKLRPGRRAIKARSGDQGRGRPTITAGPLRDLGWAASRSRLGGRAITAKRVERSRSGRREIVVGRCAIAALGR
jgi:hypothetical protein